MWHIHEEPRDFNRFAKYDFVCLFTTAEFEFVEIKPQARFVVTFGQELVYFLNGLRRGLAKYRGAGVQWLIQALVNLPNRWDRAYEFTRAYLVVARKDVR